MSDIQFDYFFKITLYFDLPEDYAYLSSPPLTTYPHTPMRIARTIKLSIVGVKLPDKPQQYYIALQYDHAEHIHYGLRLIGYYVHKISFSILLTPLHSHPPWNQCKNSMIVPHTDILAH